MEKVSEEKLATGFINCTIIFNQSSINFKYLSFFTIKVASREMIVDGERICWRQNLNNDFDDINNLNGFIRHNLFSLSFYENRKSSTELLSLTYSWINFAQFSFSSLTFHNLFALIRLSSNCCTFTINWMERSISNFCFAFSFENILT